jgi:hypothetical protein
MAELRGTMMDHRDVLRGVGSILYLLARKAPHSDADDIAANEAKN